MNQIDLNEKNSRSPMSPTFTLIENGNTKLAVADGNFSEFMVNRFFTLESSKPEIRGFHAHKKCLQVFICTVGSASIKCKDGNTERKFHLNPSSNPLLVHEGIWVEIELGTSTKILVLASENFDENDYLRDWSKYLEYKETS